MCSNDFICFYDWAECRLIQRIDVTVKVYMAQFIVRSLLGDIFGIVKAIVSSLIPHVAL